MNSRSSLHTKATQKGDWFCISWSFITQVAPTTMRTGHTSFFYNMMCSLLFPPQLSMVLVAEQRAC